jgi:hypothetical protein
MWSTRFKKIKAMFVTAIFAEASEFEKARESAYVNERLQNNFLIPTNSSSMPTALTDHDSLQVRSQGVARRSCGAH